MKSISIILIIITIALQGITYAQPGLPNNVKATVYRILRHDGPNISEATGFMFYWDNEICLITNKHVGMLDSTRAVDSLVILKNKELSGGDVISGPEQFVVFLEKGGKKFYYPFPDTLIDLMLILIARENSNLPPMTILSCGPQAGVLSYDKLQALCDSTSIVTMIGFPTKSKYLSERTQEYLWGRLKYLDSTYIAYDIPALKGNSGSPIFINKWGKYYLVGIHHGRRNDLGIGIPASRIYESIQNIIRMNQKDEVGTTGPDK